MVDEHLQKSGPGQPGPAIPGVDKLDDLIGVVRRVHSSALGARRVAGNLALCGLAVPVVWILGLLAVGLLPGIGGVLALILVLIVWSAAYIGVRWLLASLDSIERGLNRATGAMQSGTIQADLLRTMPRETLTKLASDRSSLLSVHSAYRSVRGALGTASDLKSINAAPYAAGVGGLLIMAFLFGIGLLLMIVGVLT